MTVCNPEDPSTSTSTTLMERNGDHWSVVQDSWKVYMIVKEITANASNIGLNGIYEIIKINLNEIVTSNTIIHCITNYKK